MSVSPLYRGNPLSCSRTYTHSPSPLSFLPYFCSLTLLPICFSSVFSLYPWPLSPWGQMNLCWEHSLGGGGLEPTIYPSICESTNWSVLTIPNVQDKFKGLAEHLGKRSVWQVKGRSDNANLTWYWPLVFLGFIKALQRKCSKRKHHSPPHRCISSIAREELE